MANVSPINPSLQSLKCPAPLRALPAWLVWRYEENDGGGKPRKVPYYAGGGRRTGIQGRPEDRNQLVTFDAARAAAARRGMSGVGFCPLPEFGITALDFDGCVVDGGLDPFVERLVQDTYAEFSPSGNGVRAFVRGNLGNSKSHEGEFGFELFASKGFVTFTGNLLPLTELFDQDNTIAEPGAELLEYCKFRFGRKPVADLREPKAALLPPLGLTDEQLHECLDVLPLELDYDTWFKVGGALHHERQGSDEAFDWWDEKFSQSGKYTDRAYGQFKWNSMGRGERQVTARWLVDFANMHGAHVERPDRGKASLEDFDEIEDGAADDGDDFQVIEDDGTQQQEEKPSRFALVTVSEDLKRPPPDWVIDELLPQATLAMVYGEWSSGKSFATLDLVLHIAMGMPWRGLKVVRQKVVYILGEGQGSFKLRVKAWCDLHQVDPAALDEWFILMKVAPNLTTRPEVKEAAQEIRKWGGAGVIVVDTLARATSGANENSGEDMGKAIEACQDLTRILKVKKSGPGPTVVLVHHAGKDASRGTRGWSGLPGAADTLLEVKAQATGHVLRVEKQKDGDDTLQWAFALDRVEVGMRDDLRVITSCVVRPLDALPVQQAQAKALGKWEQVFVDALTALLEASGDTGADFEDVLVKALELAPPHTGTGRDTRRQTIKRAGECLCGDETTPYRLENGRVCVD